tara:strand:- start:314 stop:1306 length:993 start_codon:yes stop_codon:yes gene_type:complete
MNIELIPLIIKKRINISIFVVICLFFGFLYSIFSTPLYNAHVTIYPSESEQKVSSISDFGNMLSQFQNFSGFGNNLSSTTYHIKDLVESDILKQNIVQNKWFSLAFNKEVSLIEYWELDQNNYDSFFDRIKNSLFSIITDDLNDIRLSNAKNILETRIQVLEEDSGLFIINVLMEEPKLASEIANYISTYIQTYVSSKSTDRAKKNTLFIKDRLNEVEEKLKLSEDKLMEFFKKNPTIDTPALQFENLTLTRDLETNQGLYLTILQELEIAKIEELKELEIIQILDSAIPPIEKSKPNLILVLIIIFNFSFLMIVSFYFILENYFKKIKK